MTIAQDIERMIELEYLVDQAIRLDDCHAVHKEVRGDVLAWMSELSELQARLAIGPLRQDVVH